MNKKLSYAKYDYLNKETDNSGAAIMCKRHFFSFRIQSLDNIHS